MSRSTWKPGSARQHQVEHDGVVVDRARLLAGVAAVVQHVHGVAFLLEPALDEPGDLAIVFDHEDAHDEPTRYRSRQRPHSSTVRRAGGMPVLDALLAVQGQLVVHRLADGLEVLVLAQRVQRPEASGDRPLDGLADAVAALLREHRHAARPPGLAP